MMFVDNIRDEILRNIKIILETPRGTCPLDRDFGLSATFLDAPVAKAEAALRVEIIEQIEKYEPRAKVKSISFEADQLEGVLTPKVILI